jgi:hypothetical protein
VTFEAVGVFFETFCELGVNFAENVASRQWRPNKLHRSYELGSASVHEAMACIGQRHRKPYHGTLLKQERGPDHVPVEPDLWVNLGVFTVIEHA